MKGKKNGIQKRSKQGQSLVNVTEKVGENIKRSLLNGKSLYEGQKIKIRKHSKYGQVVVYVYITSDKEI